MEKDTIIKMILMGVIIGGFETLLTHKLYKALLPEDIDEIYGSAYQYYQKDRVKPTNLTLMDEITVSNLNILLKFFLDKEDYEKCNIIKTHLELFKKEPN